MIGKTISHFQIIAQLGGGGMGVVYRARDTKLGRDVALKFLPPHLADDPEAKSRFIQEAEAASALDHANICTIHEIGEARTDETGAPLLFIAMAFYGGQTLKYRLQSDPLSVEESIRIARQIARGLQRAHEHGIVHRDIKPANIMVTDRNEVKILDFGLAKLTGRIDLTQSGSTLGTAAYMAPEQVRGEAVDHRTDIWALGVVLYQMLTGFRPFDGEYQHAISYKILHEEPMGFAGLPDGLREVVERCLRKDADDRFQTTAEVAEALDELADASATSVGHTNNQKEPGLHRRWIAAGIASALLVAVVFGFMYWPLDQPATSDRMTEAGAVETVPDRQRLIVIPFDNLGAPEYDYFADGISEEIMMRLWTLKDLAVISRNTAVRYKDSDKTTSQIGEELDVDYALEGTVRWAHQTDGSSLVRISAQLIRVSDDSHVWADSYEGQPESIFEIQKQVAGQVAEALSLTLGSGEDGGGEDVPTSNIEAYQAYLKALPRVRAAYIDLDNWDEAAALLERALELDPLYLDASALLTRVAASQSQWKGGDEGARYREMAEGSLTKTTAIGPGSAQAAVAAGYYSLYVGADYERARSEFRSALDLAPGLADARLALATIEMRLGNYEASTRLNEELLADDPMNPRVHAVLSAVYGRVRRYGDALDEASVAYALGGNVGCYIVGLATQVDGNTARATGFQREIRESDTGCSVVAWYERDFDAALAYRDTLEVPADLYERANFFDTRVQYEWIAYWLRARFSRFEHRREVEDRDLRGVIAFTDSLGILTKQTGPAGLWSVFLAFRALANAALGDRKDALNTLEKLRAGSSHDPHTSSYWHPVAVQVFIMLGMHEEALDVLEADFTGPGAILPVDLTTAVYDPLRTHPRFQALVARHPWP